MTVYFIYYILIGFFALLASKIKINGKKITGIIVLFIALFLIIGLRHPTMGIDLRYLQEGGYLERFQYIATLDWKTVITHQISSYEQGYTILNKIFSIFGLDVQILLLCTSFMSLFPIFYLYKKYSESFYFSLIIYLSTTGFLAVFSSLRQAIAIGICVMSYKFIKEKRIIPFVLIILLASTIHTGALVFLISYPIYHIKLNKKTRIITLILIAVIFAFGTQLFKLSMTLFNRPWTVDNNGAITLFLMFLCIYGFCWFFSNKDDADEQGLLNLILLLVLFQSLGRVHSYISREAFFYMPFLGLAIPKACNSIKGNSKIIVRTALIVIFVATGLYLIYSSGSGWPQSYPYHFFWEKLSKY